MTYEQLKIQQTKINNRIEEFEQRLLFAARRFVIKNKNDNENIKQLHKEFNVDVATAKEFVARAKRELQTNERKLNGELNKLRIQ